MAKEYKAPDQNIDDISVLEPEGTYSYADYLRWTFEERVELIKGKLFPMSPAPNRMHQQVSGNLFLQVGNLLRKQKCKVFYAPFDVRFPESPGDPDSKIFTVVQPDIFVVCDEAKLDDRGCLGAPDLIVEILSPSTASKDLKNKYQLYEEKGVREYWVVYPGEQVIEIFRLLPAGSYDKPIKLTDANQITSEILPGLNVTVEEIFDF